MQSQYYSWWHTVLQVHGLNNWKYLYLQYIISSNDKTSLFPSMWVHGVFTCIPLGFQGLHLGIQIQLCILYCIWVFIVWCKQKTKTVRNDIIFEWKCLHVFDLWLWVSCTNFVCCWSMFTPRHWHIFVLLIMPRLAEPWRHMVVGLCVYLLSVCLYVTQTSQRPLKAISTGKCSTSTTRQCVKVNSLGAWSFHLRVCFLVKV